MVEHGWIVEYAPHTMNGYTGSIEVEACDAINAALIAKARLMNCYILAVGLKAGEEVTEEDFK